MAGPEEYANAVLGYSRLSTGAGQNHISLGQYLSTSPTTVRLEPRRGEDDFVTLYPLGDGQVSQQSSSQSPPRSSDGDGDLESADERHHKALKPLNFQDHSDFYSYNINKPPQSSIIFLRGFMTAQWINNIGARYVVDPEFFCRHLDFGPANDNANNFSIPALPSSSGHLIELPIITIGKRTASTDALRADKIDELRSQGASALAAHHHQISKLASSKMKLGDSMVRDFHIFDEIHYAIEQRISICMQPTKKAKKDYRTGQTFTRKYYRSTRPPVLPQSPKMC
jgi:hypothetical protein